MNPWDVLKRNYNMPSIVASLSFYCYQLLQT